MVVRGREEEEGCDVVVDVQEAREKMVTWARSLSFMAIAVGTIIVRESRIILAQDEPQYAFTGGAEALESERLDLPFGRRLRVLGARVGLTEGILVEGIELEGSDTLHVRMLDSEPNLGKLRRGERECEICMEVGWEQMVIMGPCSHDICMTCFTRHRQAFIDSNRPGQLTCPMCRQELTSAVPAKEAKEGMKLWQLGGTIVRVYIAIMSQVGYSWDPALFSHLHGCYLSLLSISKAVAL